MRRPTKAGPRSPGLGSHNDETCWGDGGGGAPTRLRGGGGKHAGYDHTLGALEVTDRLLTVGQVLQRLPSVASCVLALPPHQQLWAARLEAEAQDLRDDVLQGTVSPDHGGRFRGVATQMDRATDVAAEALNVELGECPPGGRHR